MSGNSEWRPHCARCGRFTPWTADSFTPWGGYGDDEPPDPEHLCDVCAETAFRRTLAGLLLEGMPPYDARGAWVPGDYWHRARVVARGLWRHGLRPRPVRHDRVRHERKGVRMVWWCGECGRPDRHPAHDPGEAQRLHTPYCRFVSGRGRHIGRMLLREWCACGWNTGWHPVDGYEDRLVDYLGTGRLLRDHIDTARGWRWLGWYGRYERLVDGEWVGVESVDAPHVGDGDVIGAAQERAG